MLADQSNVPYQFLCFPIFIFHSHHKGIDPRRQSRTIEAAIPGNGTDNFSGSEYPGTPAIEDVYRLDGVAVAGLDDPLVVAAAGTGLEYVGENNDKVFFFYQYSELGRLLATFGILKGKGEICVGGGFQNGWVETIVAAR